MAKTILNENIHISVLIKNKGNLLANANISVFSLDYGFITIKNFQIWRSKQFNDRLGDAVNITPPSQNSYGKYHKIVFFERIDKWNELEEQIYKVYIETINLDKSKLEHVDLDEVIKGLELSKQ